MPSVSVLALVLAQATFLPLDSASDDDRPVDSVFSADGRYLFVAHASSGSITRLDTTSGAVDRRLDLGAALVDVELTAGGTLVLALDDTTPSLHVLSAPSLQLLGTVPLSLGLALSIQPDASGSVAVVEGLDAVSVVDLGTLQEARTIALPAFTTSEFVPSRVRLGSDDRSLAALGNAAGGHVGIFGFDAYSGAATGSVTTPASLGSFAGFAGSADRGTVAVAAADFQPAWTAIHSYDALGLALRATTTVNGLVPLMQLTLSRDGARAFGYRGSTWVSVPLVGGTVGVGLPGTAAATVEGILRFAVSSDERRVVFFTPGATVVTDELGALLGRVGGSWASVQSASTDPTVARWAVLDAFSERVRVLDASATPPSLAGDWSTGFFVEVDGPFAVAALASARAVVAVATGSDRLLTVDADTGAVLGALSTARGPRWIERLDGDCVLVGHDDGTLSTVDPLAPGGPVELGRVQLAGSVTEVVPVAGTNRAWVRVEDGFDVRLALVELLGPQAGVVTSTRLAVGPGNPPVPLQIVQRGTLVVDPVHGLAYAYSAGSASLEVVDISQTPLRSIAVLTAPELRNQRGALALTPDGSRLFAHSIPGPSRVVAVDTPVGTGAGLAVAWVVSAPLASGTTSPRSISIDVSDDGGAVIVDLVGDGPFGLAGPGFTALRVSDGAEVVGLGPAGSGGFDEAADRFVIGLGSIVLTARWDGAAWSDFTLVPTPRVVIGPPSLGAAQGFAAFPSPDLGAFDGQEGVVVLDLFAGATSVHCDGGVPNATGVQAELRASGSIYAGGVTDFTVSGLQPGAMIGMLVVGSALVPPMPAGGLGRLCVGGTVGRLTTQVQTANAAGAQRFVVDTSAVPTSVGALAIQAGQAWTFQGWHRDQAPGGAATSNTSTALRVRFR